MRPNPSYLLKSYLLEIWETFNKLLHIYLNLGSICYIFMATEKAERKKGTWSPWIHFQWYRKRCNRIHKYYQASKLQEKSKKSTTKIIGLTQNSLAANKSLPTESSNLRLYWIKIKSKNFVFPTKAVLLIIPPIYTGILWYEYNHPNRTKNKTYFDITHLYQFVTLLQAFH